MSVVDRLTEMLDQQGVAFQVRRHDPVYTSEEAARVRGTSLASGAKALVCKADGQFVMFVMPANRRLASKMVRKNESIRRLRFASRAEVAQLTGLQPGSIPPFGSLFDLPTWCDEVLAEQSVINFNAGDHAVSINMSYADYVSVEQPKLGRFTAAEGG
jgi:Ala-tRNA(Pro) deacylase